LRNKPGRHISIRTKITIFAFAIFLISLFIVGLVIESTVLDPFERKIGEDAMDIALSVASIPSIQENVGKPGGSAVIDPVADGIRKKIGVEYVVVMDMHSVRYSHPVKERIGLKFVGGDEGAALDGKAYISKAVGTLGPSMRAFVPIFRGNRQVGAVSVGILLNDIRAIRHNLTQRLMFALFLGLASGLVGAQFLAWNIKKGNRGLEPHEIVRILKEREVIMDSIPEGILAVDDMGNISMINDAAKKLLGVEDGDVLGKPAEEHIPNTRLPQVVKTGEAELDREQILMDRHVLTNRIPLEEKGRVIGAIASFKDMSVVQSMAEELTGVRKYLEALRVRNHEFLNKLQTISGLIQLGEYKRAVEFISGVVDVQQNLVSLVTRRFRNPSVGGLLLGKTGRCKELGINFEIDPDSYLAQEGAVSGSALIVIVGNLLENAMESVLQVERQRRNIYFSLFDESDRIILSVRDTGVGIPREAMGRIFEKGFTTKEGDKRGYGLFNVRSLIESYGGEINLVSEEGLFTEFVVNLPNERGGS